MSASRGRTVESAAKKRSTQSSKEGASTVEFIAPPDEWKSRMAEGRGVDKETAEARAKNALATLHTVYVDHVNQLLAGIETLLSTAASQSESAQKKTLSDIHKNVAEIKSEAGSLGLSLAAQISSDLCRYIESGNCLNALRLESIAVQTSAIRVVINQNLDEKSDQARALLAGIDQIIAKASK